MSSHSTNPFLSLLIYGCAISLTALSGGSGAVLIYGAVKQKLPPPEIVEEQPAKSAPAPAPQTPPEISPPSTPDTEAGPPIAENTAPVEAALMAEGQKIYNVACMACHQATGQGMPPIFPPLAGSDWITSEKPDRAIAVILNGLQGPITVNGKPFTTSMIMPPQGITLDDAKVAAVLTYARNTWGNKGSAVSPDKVRELREKYASKGIWTEETLNTEIQP